MSVITANPKFAFDARIHISQPTAAGRPTPHGFGGIAGRLVAALRWIAGLPRRRAVIQELETLTDHELADIGLSRVTLHQVFDRDFAVNRAG